MALAPWALPVGDDYWRDQDARQRRLAKLPRYIVGLDLGQKQDFTALCILEKHGGANEAVYHCRHLHRYKLGTNYPAIVSDVRELCLREPLLDPYGDLFPDLAIDQTGVGGPVVELFTLAKPSIKASIRPIVIHGGDAVTREGGVDRVPKRTLVSVTQAALQTDRLKIAADLPEANTLTTELQNFQVKISESGFDSYEARCGKHDDLVLALAMALWVGHNDKGGWGSQPLKF